MPRRQISGKRILLTGASQGIGHALARELVSRGANVLAVARNESLLDELSQHCTNKPGIIYLQRADITSPHDRSSIMERINSQFGGLDILINNAGVGATGHLTDTSAVTLRQIFEVNYFAAAELMRLSIPYLKAGNDPLIVNISSVLGKRAWPARGAYSASKFALQGLSEAVRAELVDYGIDVLVINPGLTITNFSENLIEKKAKLPLDHLRGMTADAVAQATTNAMERRYLEITFTWRGKLLVLVNRAVPWLIDRIAKRKVRQLYEEDVRERTTERNRFVKE